MMKRIFALALCLFLLMPLLPTPIHAAEPVTVNLYNWGQYLSDGSDGCIDVIAEFEAKYPHIKINQMTFDSNESMYTKLSAGGSSFDLIIPSDYMVEKLIQEDMLLPINHENVPNFQYVDKRFRDPTYDPGNVYSMPYTWGSVGIIYNSAFVAEEDVAAQSWDLLWNEKYANKILMFDNPRDAFAVAQFRLGYSINTEDPDELEACAKLLREQKPLVQSYVMDQVFDKMQRGEAWIAPYYAGDYLLMAGENEDLKFYRPVEGYNLFVDSICIPKGAEHKEEAELFINFLLEPEICGGNLEYIGYSSPETASKEFMDPEVANSPVAYPDEEELAQGREFSALSQESTQYMNALWLTVKTADTATTVYLVMTIIGVVLTIVLWISFKVRKRKAKARRCQKWKNEEC
ncbi:MAG: spermidine/putrescine ABC transporter substrate-binding protein [Oscillospiraceae bacterium]|nr:spermidine/putrescine ABC transporter substrate-binding protein [Oscillospiraceae bacterium]